MLKSLYVVLLILLLSSCIDAVWNDLEQSCEIQPNIAFPIGHFRVDVKDNVQLPNQFPTSETFISFVAEDSVSIDIGEKIENREDIISSSLLFHIENYAPAKVMVDLFYVDNINRRMKLTNKAISTDAAILNVDGSLNSQVVSRNIIELSTRQITDLHRAKKLIVKVAFENLKLSSQTYSHIDTYRVITTIGMQAQINYQINQE